MTVSTGGRLGRGTLIALVTAEFFITLDGSALTVALPTIRDSLDLNAAALQWTQIAYMVAAAALALPFGAMGDRLGRRRVLAGRNAPAPVGVPFPARGPSNPDRTEP